MQCRVKLANLGGNTRGQTFASRDHERTNATTTFHNCGPEFLQGTSDGGYDANPGDDDAIHAEVFVPRSSFTAAEI